jgi:hypothetical protein
VFGDADAVPGKPLPLEVHTKSGQYLTPAAKMERLGIGNDAVEIKQDCVVAH